MPALPVHAIGSLLFYCQRGLACEVGPEYTVAAAAINCACYKILVLQNGWQISQQHLGCDVALLEHAIMNGA